MRRRFHALAGVAGALACGLAALAWRAAAPPPFVAHAVVGVAAEADSPAASDLAALRALATSDVVLRKAALAPETAAAVARAARPGPAGAFLDLVRAPADGADTLGRAADLLAARVSIEPGAAPHSARVVARMEESETAAGVANAVAAAIVAAHNEAAAKIERRLDRPRRERLARAESRRDAARERLASLRAVDPTPTASIAAAARLPTDAAALALTDAQRAALAAEARRAEAARIYGPRHPEMIRLETESRRATATLQAASARMANAKAPRATVTQASDPPKRAPAEGGPDPRGADLADAQDEVDRAEAAYEREAVRFAAPARAARVMEPAQPPARSGQTPAGLAIAAAAVCGFLLFGAAPGIGAHARRRARTTRDRPDAVMRRGRFDGASARRLVAAMDIAASAGARRICVRGENAGLVREAARALGAAALAEGWLPLTIGADEGERPTGMARFEGRAFATSATPTRAGELLVAVPTGRRSGAAPDADIAFDLVIFGEETEAARIDVAIWIGAAAPDDPAASAAASAADLWIVPA